MKHAFIVLPTLRQLQFLSALVKRRSFSRAAEDCLVSQSTLSAGIKELETVLQTHLIDRSTRKLSLTPAGSRVAEKGDVILALADDLAQSALASRPLEGQFRLGVIPTIAPFLLPSAVPDINRAHPKLSLFLQESRTLNLLDDLHKGHLDAALLALPFEMPDLNVVEIGEDPFHLAVAASSALATQQKINISDLANVDLLLLEDGHCLRGHAIEACQLAGKGASAGFGATSLATLAPMVAIGMGATLLPQMAIKAGFADAFQLVTRPIMPPGAVRKIGLGYRRGSGRRDEVELLAEFFRASLLD